MANEIKLQLTNQNGATLYTANTYCNENIIITPKLAESEVTPTEADQIKEVPSGYAGLKKVTVKRIPEQYIVPTGTKNITQNGPDNIAEYAEINVQVQPKLQEKTVKFNGEVTYDQDYEGLSKVTVALDGSFPVTQEVETEITTNGDFEVLPDKDYDALSKNKISVNVDTVQLNGIIEQYSVRAGAKVEAGDFVEFINQWNKGEIVSTNPYQMVAKKLDNHRVLIAYNYQNTTTTNTNLYYYYLIAIKIENGVISKGSPLYLNYSSYGYYFDMDVLSSSRAIFSSASYYRGYDHTMYLIGIEDLKLSKVSSITTSDAYSAVQVAALDSTHFCRTYSVCDSGTFVDVYSYITYYSVAEDSIKAIVTSRLTDDSLLDFYSLLRLTPTKVWAVRGTSRVGYCYGFSSNAITASTSTITLGSNFQRATTLSESKVVVTYSTGQAQVVAIDGTNQSLGPLVNLASYFSTSVIEKEDGTTETITTENLIPISASSLTPLSETQVLIVYYNSRDKKSYAVVGTVKDKNIYLGEKISYTDYSDINNLLTFSGGSALNIYANEFIASIGINTVSQSTGEYQWNETIDLSDLQESTEEGEQIIYPVNFLANDQTFIGISKKNEKLFYILENNDEIEAYNGAWLPEYKDFTVLSTITDLSVLGLLTQAEQAIKLRKPIVEELTNTYVAPATSRLFNVGVAHTGGADGEIIEVYCVKE